MAGVEMREVSNLGPRAAAAHVGFRRVLRQTMPPADPRENVPRGALRLGSLCRRVEAPYVAAKGAAVARRQAMSKADARDRSGSRVLRVLTVGSAR